MHTVRKEFDWANELHQTMVKSLTTSFGLDFLLFEDKKGGDVDTVHKVREYQKDLKNQKASDIHVSGTIKESLDKDGKNVQSYDSKSYHADGFYKEQGKLDKEKHVQGELHDAYRNHSFSADEKRQLDHVVSAHEIHNDAGRILSETDGVKLANQSDNLASTQAYINNRKSDLSIQDFVQRLPEMKKEKRRKLTDCKPSCQPLTVIRRKRSMKNANYKMKSVRSKGICLLWKAWIPKPCWKKTVPPAKKLIRKSTGIITAAANFLVRLPAIWAAKV